MSAEHATHAPQGEITFRKAVGASIEVGAVAGTTAELLLAGLALWPIAIGGAIFLIGRGIRRSGQKEQASQH